MSWLTYALISDAAAALTAILAKIGVAGVPSALATAIRTVVVVVWDAAKMWWEMHLPDKSDWSHRTRETKAEPPTESAWLIPSWRN